MTLDLQREDSEFERELILSTRDDGPTEAARAAALVAVTAACAAPLAIGATSATGAGAGKGAGALLAKWALVAAVGGGLVAAALGAIPEKASSPERVAPSALPAAASTAPSIAAAESEPIPVVAVSALPRATAPSASAVPAKERPIGQGVTAIEVRSAETLKREVQALGRAQAALKGGDPTRALAELGAYDAAFPAGALEDEAAALRVAAEVQAGDKATARRHAELFLKTRPASPHAARVRLMLDRMKASDE